MEQIIDCNEKLKEYLLRNTESTTELLRIINDTDLVSVIDRNFLRELNFKQYIKHILWDKRQKKMNELFEEEIIRISHEFNEKQIRVVFLKGLILAQKLYKQPEIRKSDDIDILFGLF